MLKRFFVAAIMTVSLLTASLSMGATSTSPALQALMDGNNNFVAGNLTSLTAKSGSVTREEVALGQHPIAIVLDCSDSRLSPEIIFDKGLGELFVIRVAGNVLDKHQVASIQYAVEHLNTRLLVIMGHERCGAVGAAFSSLDSAGLPVGTPGDPAAVPPVLPTGYYALTPELKYLVDTKSLKDAVIETKTLGTSSATECALFNVNNVYNEIMLDPMITDLGVEVVKAFYDLDDGKVSFLPATSILTVKASSSNPAMGSIAPAGDSAVAFGANQPFVITPAKGFALSQLLVNGVPVPLPSGNSYVLTGVTVDNTTVVASFTSTAPVAVAVEWVGAQATGVDGAVKVWWPLSSTAGAVYNVFKDGVLLQANVAGTSIITPNQPNGTYVFSVQATSGGTQPSASTFAPAVIINKTAVAPAWLGATKGGAGIKLWWPTVTTPGATYVITENGTPITYTLQTSGSLSYTILPAKAPSSGVYSYTIQTKASGYNDSAVTGGASVTY